MSILKNKIFNKKTVSQNLKIIFGIGFNNAKIVCKNLGINENFLFSQLKKDQINKILSHIEKYYLNIESNLIIKNKNVFSFLQKLKNYKYFRHKYNMPVRGQRTHT